MPAGVTWGKYLTFSIASLISMFAGAQVVHSYYRPLDDLDDLIRIELERRKASESNKN